MNMALRKTNIPVTKIQNVEVTSFEINVDKLKYRLTILFPKVHAQVDGWSIISVVITAFIPFVTCEFKDFLQIPGKVWMSIFALLILWMLYEVYNNWRKGRKSITIDEFVEELMDGSIVTTSAGKTKKYKKK